MQQQNVYFFMFSTRIAVLVFMCQALVSTPQTFSAALNAVTGKVIDYTIAIADNRVITSQALQNEIILRQIESGVNESRRKALERLIDRKLMLEEAEKWGIPLMDWGSQVEAEINAIRSKFPSESAFLQSLMDKGIDIRDVREWLEEKVVVEELIARRWDEPLRRRIDDAQMNEAAIRYFEQNPSEFTHLQYQYVMVPFTPAVSADSGENAKKRADTIASYLREGKEFSDIQRTDTDDLPIVVGEEPRMLRTNGAIASALAQLKINGVSDPILTGEGYLIAKLVDRRDASYSEVSEAIKAQLIEEKRDAQIRAWLAEQRGKADIRILDPDLVNQS